MKYNVAVVGATGAVGREILQILDERRFPINNIFAVASSNSAGKEISFGDQKTLKIQSLDKFNFDDIDIALFSAGGDIAKMYAPKIAKKGCIVIDNSSAFRTERNVPLIVPEVNSNEIKKYKKELGGMNIISNPNCSTIQLVVALKPLHDNFKVKRVVVSTYQATSGAGKPAMDELFNQTKGIFVNQEVKSEEFTKQIAFNVIPHIDIFMDDGSTKEEWKMVFETKKILDPSINIISTCVRVPVFIGHSEAVFVELEKPYEEKNIKQIFRKTKSISIVDHRADEGYVTPLEAAGEDSVFLSRIRRDNTVKNGISFWCVADNLRKGAALNAVQIAENL